MGFFTLFLIAVSLAMDAFAVSVSNGICTMDFKPEHAVKLGICFGGFQFLMPVLGWFLGNSVKSYIEAIDHWIAFVLLGVIGFNMIREAFDKDGEIACQGSFARETLSAGRLVVQGIATSIDALAVGIGLALLDINILYAASIVGMVAFLFSFLGGLLGKGLGGLFQKRAQLLGGGILIVIGLKILLEHTILM